MGFFRRNPVELEIIRLERALYYAESDDERDAIETRLERMYELDSRRRANGIHVTGDGLLKCGCAAGLALAGYLVERNGGILPRWSQIKI